MKLDAFIPGFLKKIDNYLLKNHPNLWITNIHFVLFYTLLLDGVLFFLANMFGFSLTDDIPDVEVPLLLMILPAVLVFVFWFIKQARYNVDKNFGTSNIAHDYQNFIIYFVVIFLFYSVAAIIPHSLIFKVKNAVSTEQLEHDIDILNQGYVYFDGYNVVSNEGEIEVYSRQEFVYRYENNYDTEESYEYYGVETISERKALGEIEAFIKTYNKYTIHKIKKNPQEILSLALNGEGYYLYDYEIYDYDSYRENVDWKLEKMHRIHSDNYGYMLSDTNYLKVIFAMVGILALVTWMFKNVHWKNFLAAGITVILSPFLMALVGLFLFVVIGVRNDEGVAIMFVIILFNLASFLWWVIPFAQQRYSYMSVINGMLLQLWTPFSVFVYSALLIEINRHSYDYYDEFYYDYWDYWNEFLVNTYWIGWGVLIISIVIMKPFYKRMWALPKGK